MWNATLPRYDEQTGLVHVRTPAVLDDVTGLRLAVPSLSSFAPVDIKAQNIDYSRVTRCTRWDSTSGERTRRCTVRGVHSFFYYGTPVTVSGFDPMFGPDYGQTGVRVSGDNMISNQGLPPYSEVRCKFGGQINKQATFLTGTGYLLCIPADYRTEMGCGGAQGLLSSVECPHNTSVPLAIVRH